MTKKQVNQAAEHAEITAYVESLQRELRMLDQRVIELTLQIQPHTALTGLHNRLNQADRCLTTLRAARLRPL